MVLFEVHQRFKGHFLNELPVSVKIENTTGMKDENISDSMKKFCIKADFYYLILSSNKQVALYNFFESFVRESSDKHFFPIGNAGNFKKISLLKSFQTLER